MKNLFFVLNLTFVYNFVVLALALATPEDIYDLCQDEAEHNYIYQLVQAAKDNNKSVVELKEPGCNQNIPAEEVDLALLFFRLEKLGD